MPSFGSSEEDYCGQGYGCWWHNNAASGNPNESYYWL